MELIGTMFLCLLEIFWIDANTVLEILIWISTLQHCFSIALTGFSVLQNVLDQSENLCSRNSLLELCGCFSDIHQFWCERMSEIGRRTVSVVNLGSRGIAHTSEPGRPKFVIAEELLENLRSLGCT